MEVIQARFLVPSDIAVGLASGANSRFGSVVRDSTGIIAHLKEVPVPDKDISKSLDSAARALSSKKVLLLAALAVLTVLGVVLLTRMVLKRLRRRRAEQAEALFAAARSSYANAIREERMTPEVLSSLDSSLRSLRQRASLAGLDLDSPSTEELAQFSALVRDYGTELLKANNVAILHEAPLQAEQLTARQLLEDLEANLALQRDLWDAA